ncbi:hypothetical protein ACFQDN_23255 [Pseudomonas asuensis]|uniref:F-box domain-containing protein n=1 Tax=Pseudomonas asuensis TaxID=1825787 RepID=A0ABQ2H507_9PSED|nr:hypothetical protein [Pseudomonas asuensis]GGM32038.1 hypothetical protein GCM10009425_48230 [Pseudomonas asuensis]
MDPIRGSSSYNVQSSNAANPTEAAEVAAGARPSGHADLLIPRMLSDHAVAALNAKETQGTKLEKTLAGFAKQAIGSGQLKISPNPPENGIAQFGMCRNQDVLVIKAKLNEQSNKYDVLSVGFRRGSEEPISMKLSAPAPYPTSHLERMPKELINMILDNISNRGPNSRVTSLTLSSKHLYALGVEKTQEKAKCSALLDRLTAIKNIPANQGPGGLGDARLIEFKAVLGKVKEFRGKEKMDLIEGLVDNISNLNFKSGDGFKLMLDLAESLSRSKALKSADPEHKAAQIHDQNKTVANLVSKLARAGIGSDVSDQDRPEVFEKLCSILEGLEGKNGANHAAAALPNLASWYLWHSEKLGPERFGKLIELANRNKLDTNDELKSEMLTSLTSKLAQHDEAEDIANHFNVLCGISQTIERDETKARVITYMTERLNWIEDEALREISKNHIADAVGTINNPVLKAQVAAVTPVLQND